MIEERVVQVLDGLGVPYELMQIDPAFADTAACCEKYGLPLDSAGNTIVAFTTHAPNFRGSFFEDRKSTRLNSSHVKISYAVFCLKKKKKKNRMHSCNYSRV